VGAELLGPTGPARAFSLRCLIFQNLINCRRAKVVTLLELQFWYLHKPVQLTNSFLVFCRYLIAFLVVKLKRGRRNSHLVCFLEGLVVGSARIWPVPTDLRD
jgi:hypothetical protein